MLFLLGDFGTLDKSQYPSSKGIRSLRHAQHTQPIGGSRLSSPTLTFETRSDGSTQMVSSTGDALLVSPAPMMWDSTAAAGTEPSATSSGDSLIEVPVEAESIQRHTTVLTLTPEAE